MMIHMNNNNANNFLHIQMLGMVNALKTGDPTIDMILAMALPYLASIICKDLVKWIKKLFSEKVKLSAPKCERTITHRSTFTTSGGQIGNNYNLCLIKAIQLYVHANCKLDLKEAEMRLTVLDSNKKSNTSNRNSTDISTSTLLSTSAFLKSFSMIEQPISKQWLDIGDFAGQPVSLYMEDSFSKGGSSDDEGGGGNGNGGGGKIRDLRVRVQSVSKESINTFLQTAYNWYVNQLQSMENNDRFLFDLQSFLSRDGSPSYRRYKLGDDKTFDSFFSQQCNDLLKIVDQFESKSGKYRIKGYPHKLGLLLTGPPGTGKTSLIKALAHYTGRHIVNVPLSRITTNSNLMSLLFNKRYQTHDSGTLTSLDFNEVIFVFEDVDASSNVVKFRKLLEEERKKAAELDDNYGTNRKIAATTPVTRPSIVTGDSLNLTGLLNALDGVVETPGRIVIMTMNHPEILDHALIRPCRIDKRLNLSYMIVPDMIKMLEHYFETTLGPEEEKRIRKLIDHGLEMTAAQLEQLAIENETTDSLIASLERREYDGSECTSISDSSSCTSDPCKK
jgi:chaperone BCS1